MADETKILHHTDECIMIHRLASVLPRHRFTLESIAAAPTDGLYLVYEKSEECGGPDGQSRVVRVGINKKEGRLGKRLKQHVRRGPSVFRRHIASALLARLGESPHQIEERYKAKTYPPATVQLVSDHITQHCLVRWIAIADQDTRRHLEQRLVRSLSVCDGCVPSTKWLGRLAYNHNVKCAGLWNDQLTKRGSVMQQEDFNRLDSLVRGTI